MKALQLSTADTFKITLILAIFLLFLANAMGLFQANLISLPSFNFENNVLDQSSAGEIAWQQLFASRQFYCFVLVGLCLGFMLPMMSPAEGSLLTFLCMLPPYFMTYFFPEPTSLIPFEYTFLMILMLYVVNILVSYFAEIRDKQAMVNTFSQYVPSELAATLSKQPEKIELAGEARELTIFFSDLQDFTSISEQLNPKQLTLLLNEYFTVMTEVLYEYGATIDKYIGDSIMAFWGAPFDQTDHVDRSIAASLKMHEVITNIAERFRLKGWPAPKMSIGINTGVVSVGNMGSKYRVAYTVIGDAVNLASRVEHLTRTYHVSTIVTDATREQSNDYIFQELDKVQVRGKHNMTRIFTPVCHKDESNQLIEKELKKHEIALNQYYDGNLLDAAERFRDLYREYKKDYYKCMIEIIRDKS